MKLKNYDDFEYSILKKVIRKFTKQELINLDNSIFKITDSQIYYKFNELLRSQLHKLKKE